MDGTALLGSEKKLLGEMARGVRLVRTARGCRAGKRSAEGASLTKLLRLDLIEAAGDGYRISGPGMAYMRRRLDPESANRLMASTADTPSLKTAATRGARRVNRAEEPLAWLYARGKLTEQQFSAGERLRGDFLAAGEMPRMTMSWDAAPLSPGRRGPPEGLLPGERVTAAKRRLDGALEAAGPGLADVLRRTVCIGEGMETAEKAMGWPARAGRVVLTLALDRVAGFYRL